jgi:hypothetical protein
MEVEEEGDPDKEAINTIVSVLNEEPRRTSVVVLNGDPGRAIIVEGITYSRGYQIYPYVPLGLIRPRGMV